MKLASVTALGVLIAPIALAGCGIAAKVDARNNMQSSLTVYRSCLQQHAQAPEYCEGPRLAYEADMQAYRATSAGIMPGRNDTMNVNQTRR
jgi:hypothetical protein